MKFVIAQSTITQSTAQLNELSVIVTGVPIDTIVMQDFVDTDHANHSVTLQGDDLVVEIDDAVFVKYMAVYIKVARVVMPFVAPLKALFKELRSDLESIHEFFDARK